MDIDRDHRCMSREECECGVIVPRIAFFTSTYLGHIETCTRNHSHGETLNVLTSTGSVRGCSGYEVVPTNVIRSEERRVGKECRFFQAEDGIRDRVM